MNAFAPATAPRFAFGIRNDGSGSKPEILKASKSFPVRIGSGHSANHLFGISGALVPLTKCLIGVTSASADASPTL
jgi:hypothetical protein